MKKIFIGSFLLITVTCLHAQKFEQLAKLVATDRAVENDLGTAVAISGNYAVVAASEIPSLGIPNNCNCVYVFEKNAGGTWAQVQKLTKPDGPALNGFGFSVAINGNRIVVGAPGEELDDKAANPQPGAGAAYVFERNSAGTWSFIKKLLSIDRGPAQQFGYSVSISNAKVLIGAPNHRAAYLFERMDGGNWKPWCKLIAPDETGGSGFGWSVGISGDDMVVGAPGESKDTTNVNISGGGANPLQSAGAAYMFKGASEDWKKMFNHKIVYWHRSGGEQFGYAVSISGNKMVIGAPFENEDERLENPLINAGAAHMFFKQVDGRWFWDRILTPGDRTTTDNFGISVCISRDMVVVGTATKDEMAGDIKLKDAGSAYVFKYLDTYDAAGWRFFQKIVATDRAENDWFAYAVGLDNDNVIVGAPFQDRNDTRLEATDAGAAYIFTKPGCIATSSSTSVAVCKTYTSPSKKYTWTKTGVYKDTIANKADCDSIITVNLTVTNKADTSVTKKGKTLTANVKDATYNWIDCKTNQPINITTRTLIATVNGSYKVIVDQDGCVGTSSCHNIVVMATPDSTNSNPVVTTPPIVLPKNASVQKAFIEVNKIVAQDRTHNDEFGRSVSISGNYAVVGVPIDQEDSDGKNSINGAGSAYIFKLDDGGKWKQLQKIVAGDRGAGDNFGWSVGISGGYIVVGAHYDHKNSAGIKDNNLSGSAYIFELNQNGTWYQTQKITADPYSRGGQEYFGTAVAIEGRTIVVSAPDHAKDVTNSPASNITAAGALYVFERTGSSWVQTQKIVANDRELGSWLGKSVSICGNNIIAGAWGGDHDASGGRRMEAAGNAYIFERSGGVWKQTQKLAAADRSPFDEFGYSVAISGDYAVVGARRVTEKKEDENNAEYTGNAYVFKRNAGGGWSQQMKINPDDRTNADYLGTAVGISGNYLIVSAPGQDTDSLGNYMPNAGAIYVYYLDKSGNWILSDKISTFLKHQLDGFGHAIAISDCNIIGTSYIDQTDEEDKNEISNAGSAHIFTAAGCNNDGRCSGRLFPWEKTPLDKQTKDSLNAKMPAKIQSAETNAKGNEVTIENQVLTDEGLKKQGDESKKTRTDPVKKIKNLLKKN
ncbi:MAG TPA: hypothetical protein VFD56_07500 [Chitinophagaceae bacterium]|nr:hypothetical protein [Chitinophagaceae bacterium]